MEVARAGLGGDFRCGVHENGGMLVRGRRAVGCGAGRTGCFE